MYLTRLFAILDYKREYYCRHILIKIPEFENKPDNELTKIISKHESQYGLVGDLFDPYSDCKAESRAATAVKNMRQLGIEKFELEKRTISGLFKKLKSLEKQVEVCEEKNDN